MLCLLTRAADFSTLYVSLGLHNVLTTLYRFYSPIRSSTWILYSPMTRYKFHKWNHITIYHVIDINNSNTFKTWVFMLHCYCYMFLLSPGHNLFFLFSFSGHGFDFVMFWFFNFIFIYILSFGPIRRVNPRRMIVLPLPKLKIYIRLDEGRLNTTDLAIFTIVWRTDRQSSNNISWIW